MQLPPFLQSGYHEHNHVDGRASRLEAALLFRQYLVSLAADAQATADDTEKRLPARATREINTAVFTAVCPIIPPVQCTERLRRAWGAFLAFSSVVLPEFSALLPQTRDGLLHSFFTENNKGVINQ